MFKVLPDDPLIHEMDPIHKIYMFYQWQEDVKEKLEQDKSHAYIIGGFSNPEMLQKIIDKENNINQVSSTDEDFEKSLRMVKEENEKLLKQEKGRKRKRKKIGT